MERMNLQVTDVWKSYGKHEVLRGACLDVPAGALVGVVGENGAGKSTLLRIVSGQMSPDAGVVHRHGPVGYCPQLPLLNDVLTVDQHLRYFQVAYELPTLAPAYELLESLGFREPGRRRVADLSGGTRQKLNVTLALMHDPPTVVLDEPYQGFDWDTYLRFWQLAEHMRDRGRSVVVVSHLAHDAERFDLLGKLRDGQVHAVQAVQMHTASGLC